jgi:two-component system sensor histidine kinase KdpD
LEPPDTVLYLDTASIEQVLVNLLENACKFSPRNSSIEVRGCVTTFETPDAAQVTMPVYRIDIQDRGMGIPAEHIDLIFEEYTSYAGARDRSGGGLGLAICKMIVAEHRGFIWAVSDGYGTTMSFVLPMQQTTAMKQPALMAQELAMRASL